MITSTDRSAAAAFRHVSGHVSQHTRVHNLAVLHTSIDGLRSDQLKLSNKLDLLVQVSSSTAKSLQQMTRRQSVIENQVSISRTSSREP